MFRRLSASSNFHQTLAQHLAQQSIAKGSSACIKGFAGDLAAKRMRGGHQTSYLLSSHSAAKVASVNTPYSEPLAPDLLSGFDISATGKAMTKTVPLEITCRSNQGIKGTGEQALVLKQSGMSVSVTFALNNESYEVLAEHGLKMMAADIPIRLVAGETAPRTSGREHGTIILQNFLAILEEKLFSAKFENLGMKKLKLKVCYHDGSPMQVLKDKIRIVQAFECHLDEVSLQLQPLAHLQENYDAVLKYLLKRRLDHTPVVCYVILFATQQAYQEAPDRIKKMAQHDYMHQMAYLRQVSTMVNTIQAQTSIRVAIRLTVFGLGRLIMPARMRLLRQFYAELQ